MTRIPPTKLDLNGKDKKYLPVHVEQTDGEETCLVVGKNDDVVCACANKWIGLYLKEVMNKYHYYQVAKDAYEELKNEVVGTIVIDGEIISKAESVQAYFTKNGRLSYRKVAEYKKYVEKFSKNYAKLFTFMDNTHLENMNLYLVVLFYVPSESRKNIGDCLATVIDGMERAGIVDRCKNSRVYGIAKSVFISDSIHPRTEIYLMNWRGKF